MINNPIRGRLNAWFFATIDSYMHCKYKSIKQRLFKKLPVSVVEIGPGTGANLRYLPKKSTLVAIEPNRHMHSALQRKAKEQEIDIRIRGVFGEKIDLPPESVDFVFCTLVLCTVEQPEKVIAEIISILRPGGKFICIEHVQAPSGSANYKLQRMLKRPWMWVFEGCNLCRKTTNTLHTAGFSQVDIQPIVLPTIFIPIQHQIEATCIK